MAKITERVSLKDDLAALPFIAPFLLVFAVFIGYPLFYSLWISVHRVTIFSDFYDIFGTMNYVGLDNYRKVLTDSIFWWSVVLTFYYAALTIFPGIALSLALALFLNRKARGFGMLRSGFFLPNVFDLYVVGVIWLLIYNPSGGLFSWFLHSVWGLVPNFILQHQHDLIVGPGLDKPLGYLDANQVFVEASRFTRFLDTVRLDNLARLGVLNSPWLTLPAIALAMVLKNAGFGMILFLTSLNNINEALFEAADVDGCNYRQKLFHITIPLLRPIIFFLVITGTVGTLNAFSEIYAMTDDTGGTSIEIMKVTQQSARISGYHLYKVFDQSMYGEAAAISFVLLAIAVTISFVSYKVLQPKE